MKYPTGMHTN
jgi:hypothetical protein